MIVLQCCFQFLQQLNIFLKIRDDNKEVGNFLEKNVSCETVAKYVIVNKKDLRTHISCLNSFKSNI